MSPRPTRRTLTRRTLTRHTLTRRALLALTPAVLLAGCTSDPPAPEPVDPDDALRDAAAARERALLREYDAVLLAVPDLSARLLPLRGHHAEHLLALVGPPPSTSPSAAPVGTAGPAPAVPPPADAATALTALVLAERAAGTAHADDCLTAGSRALAGLLASLSASELSHPVALT